jgi:hypothetical protein
MAGEEGVAAVEQQFEQQVRGREEQGVPTKRSKSKVPAKETMESRVVGLERSITNVSSAVGDLSDQVDNLIHENAEITRAARSMIEDLGRTFEDRICPIN